MTVDVGTERDLLRHELALALAQYRDAKQRYRRANSLYCRGVADGGRTAVARQTAIDDCTWYAQEATVAGIALLAYGGGR